VPTSSKALQILEGLIYLHSKLIGRPAWASVSPQNMTLFLPKIYLSNEYMKINDLVKSQCTGGMQKSNNTTQSIQ